MGSQLLLLPRNVRRRGFAGLAVSQFLGAFNDNAFKMLILTLASESGYLTKEGLVTITSILLMLPFVLVSLPAGALSDRFSKQKVLIWTKVLEIAVMTLATLSFAWGRVEVVLFLFFLMALQSSLYGPGKFGILPELLTEEELSLGNGVIELLTFVAIILGLAAPPFLQELCGGSALGACAILAGLAVLGTLATLLLPPLPAADPARKLSANPFQGIGKYWGILKADRPLRLTVAGMVFYWSMALFLANNCYHFGKNVVGLSDKAQAIPYISLAVGVGLGSGLAGILSNRQVELGLVPLGSFGLVAFSLLLSMADGERRWLDFSILGLLGASGGLFIVPLNAFLQSRSPVAEKGGMVAASNFFQSVGMLAAGVLSFFLTAVLKLSAQVIFLIGAGVTLAASIYIFRLLPEALFRFVLWCLARLVYRIRVVGRENIPPRGPALLATNHVSFVDGLLVLASTHRFVRFIMEKEMAEIPVLRWVFRALQVIPVSTTEGPKILIRALRTAAAALAEGHVVCIFAEGQITRTGQLLPFRRGLERILKDAPLDTPLIPIHLDRVWGSLFSFSGHRFIWKWPRRVPYPVTVSIGKPLPPSTPLFALRQAVQELGTEAFAFRRESQEALHRAFARTARRTPLRKAVADSTGARRTYGALLIRSLLLARILRERWAGQEMVGLLLPPTAAGATANIAAVFSGRVPVNLNYTSSAEAMGNAVRQCGIRTVLTSRAFIEKLKLEVPGDPIWIEDLAGSATLSLRIAAFAAAFLSPFAVLERFAGRRRRAALDDLATVIFSSGSTGEPKGVMLTHANILSNLEGLAQLYNPSEKDVLLGVLPFFHSFGFTATIWFPLILGMQVVYHTNPLDAQTVGTLAREHGATYLLGTPTFLQTYARRCEPGDFGSLRHVIAGAEKLSDRSAEAFREKFGIEPLEGYGCTECSPIVAVNSPDFRARGFRQVGGKRGRIGHPIPGVTVRIVDPETLAPLPPGKEGMLVVKGPNVMKGYLGKPEMTAEVIRDGWYITGDVARMEEDGFIIITDRLSRFSKIAGEMVPHAKVEEALLDALGEAEQVLAVTSVPDEKKGERLVVLHTLPAEKVEELRGKLGEIGLPNLWLPRPESFHRIEEIPVLGTGKMDLRRVKELAVKLEGNG